MLQQLLVRDIVLIEEAKITFAEGLCVLSGETGAGKSILLDALGFVLGARADARLVRAGKEQGSVTASFDVQNAPHVPALLAELGMESEDDTLIIRRVVESSGKSRAFVNDQPVTVTALKQLGDALLEIHGQHDQKGLLDPACHRDLLDDYGNYGDALVAVRHAFGAWKDAEETLATLRHAVEQAQKDEDYWQHIEAELSDLAPEEGEDAALAEKRSFMQQAERRVQAIQGVLGELQGNPPVSSTLVSAMRSLSRTTLLSEEDVQPLHQGLERALEEVEQVASALEALAEASVFSPHELEAVEERLFAIRGLARKHQTTPDELPRFWQEVKGKLGLLADQSQQIAVLEQRLEQTKADYLAKAGKLSQLRTKAAKALEKAIGEELQSLKMAHTRVEIALEPLAEGQFSAKGVEKATFLASTNPGNPVGALHKIASGGELSRFMLALKVAMREVNATPTLIFDEIDTGTGGAVADAIGRRLAKLGEVAQVLVVTHLPQVAARGGYHLRVEKEVAGGKTVTRVLPLSAAEREEELARMLAGEVISDEARNAARKLLLA